jgi:hypothetical protein
MARMAATYGDASSQVRPYWLRGIASAVRTTLMVMPHVPNDRHPFYQQS